MGQKRRVFAILATAAVFAVAAPAYGWPHVYWKPARMAAAIVAARYPIDTSQATCRGVGKPLKGRYASFVCVATRIISDGQTSHPASTTVWARPLRSGRFCASGISLAKCRVYGP